MHKIVNMYIILNSPTRMLKFSNHIIVTYLIGLSQRVALDNTHSQSYAFLMYSGLLFSGDKSNTRPRINTQHKSIQHGMLYTTWCSQISPSADVPNEFWELKHTRRVRSTWSWNIESAPTYWWLLRDGADKIPRKLIGRFGRSRSVGSRWKRSLTILAVIIPCSKRNGWHHWR